ncbi:MAG: T9SS type A sorting domain-containing protein [Rhodothermales bacterium]|nr:T9SS type A sorting domain-containing protein [Rhodothermales bacterium]
MIYVFIRLSMVLFFVWMGMSPVVKAQDGDPASVRPGELLVYYAWPSVINGATTIGQAAAALGQYDYVILGDGLQIDTHPDYANTVAIIAHPEMANTRVFGYVDLGVTTQNLTATEYKLRMLWWSDIGADGIFLDDFGYDFGVTRDRQNDAVGFAHALPLTVIVNAWDPDHAFARTADATYNPRETRAALQAGDFYFSESFMVQEGAFVDGAFWREKADKIDLYRQSFGIEVLSVTTPGAAYDEARFHYAWHAALIDGHTATGWGEPSFASADALVPYRARPAVEPGVAFLSEAVVALPEVVRETEIGTVRVNTADHTFGFTPREDTAIEDRAGLDGMALDQVFPNPVRQEASIAFTLEAPAYVRLTVYDVLGRPVAVLVNTTLAPGRHTAAFDAASLPGGLYIGRLEAGGHFLTRPFVVSY